MSREKVKLVGRLTIELRDRSRRVVRRLERRNAIYCEAISKFANLLISGGQMGAVNAILLFNGTSEVKQLSVTKNLTQDTTDKQYVLTFKATDSSQSSYSFTDLYLGYYPSSGTGYTLAHQKPGGTITKAADQTLTITWTVYLGYDECGGTL